LQNGFDEFEVKYTRSILLTNTGNLSAALDDIVRAATLRPQSKDAKERLDMIKSLKNKKETS
jgi:hypothetical protein